VERRARVKPGYLIRPTLQDFQRFPVSPSTMSIRGEKHIELRRLKSS
jgi:hypothetical protein